MQFDATQLHVIVDEYYVCVFLRIFGTATAESSGCKGAGGTDGGTRAVRAGAESRTRTATRAGAAVGAGPLAEFSRDSFQGLSINAKISL